MDYREKYCNKDLDLSCWQHDYLFNLLKGTCKDMLQVCAKCIYFKGGEEKCQ